jgi:hypothetical protein
MAMLNIYKSILLSLLLSSCIYSQKFVILEEKNIKDMKLEIFSSFKNIDYKSDTFFLIYNKNYSCTYYHLRDSLFNDTCFCKTKNNKYLLIYNKFNDSNIYLNNIYYKKQFGKYEHMLLINDNW